MSLPAAFTITNPASLTVVCEDVVLARWNNYRPNVPRDLRDRVEHRIKSSAMMLAMEHAAATGERVHIEISQTIEVHPKEKR